MKFLKTSIVIILMTVVCFGSIHPVQALDITTSAKVDWTIGSVESSDSIPDPVTGEVHSSVNAWGINGYSYGSDDVAACDTSCTISCADDADPAACHTSCMESCLPADTSSDACSACNEDCNTDYTMCGESCNDDLNTCIYVCSDTRTSCINGCSDTRTACINVCSDNRNICMYEGCYPTHTACIEDCNTTCGDDQNCIEACSAVCDTNEQVCIGDCHTIGEGCSDDCHTIAEGCSDDCHTIADACFPSCDPIAAACFAGCKAADICQYYGKASALGTEDGVLIVDTNVRNSSLPGADATTGSANVHWENSFFNTGGEPQQYWLDFFIPGGTLWISDYSDDASTPGASAFFSMDISINGTSIWNSSALLEGNVSDHQMTFEGVDLGGAEFEYSSFQLFGYRFDDYTGVLDVGTFDPGEEIVLAYTMSVGAYAASGDARSVRASIGDPFDLRGMDVDLTDQDPNTVIPEPTTLIFIGSGLLLLLGFRRRLRK